MRTGQCGIYLSGLRTKNVAAEQARDRGGSRGERWGEMEVAGREGRDGGRGECERAGREWRD